MKKTALGLKTGWDIPAALSAVLLYLNFIAFFVTFAVAMGMVLLYPGFAVATSALLVVGLIVHLATRSRTSKLWRRLLLFAIVSNGLIIALFCAVMVLMVMAWN